MIDLDSIQFNEQGLVPVIAQDRDGAVLMLAYANREAVERTLETDYMHYWSRSRNRLWKKGETSGHTQRVISLKLDCDNDTILAQVNQTGPACHTNEPTCFGAQSLNVLAELREVFQERVENPQPNSYVNNLLSEPRRLRQKIGEEGVEVTLAQSKAELIAETADLLFHLHLLLFSEEIEWQDVLAELKSRRE